MAESHSVGGGSNDKAKESGQAPKPVTRKFVTFSRHSRKPRKRNQKAAGGWLRSPGKLLPFVEGRQAMVEVANPAHLVDGEVKRVGVGGYEGDPRIYLWSTHELDVDGIEVKKNGSKVWINLADFLASLGLRPELGIEERFDFLPADADSPVQPALMINLDKPLERKHFDTKGKSKKRSSKATDHSPTPKQEGNAESK